MSVICQSEWYYSPGSSSRRLQSCACHATYRWTHLDSRLKKSLEKSPTSMPVELESATLGWDLPNKVFRIIRARHFAPTLEVLVVLVWVVVVVTGTAVWLHFGSISSISSCISMCGGSGHWYFGRTWEVLVELVVVLVWVVIVTGISVALGKH